MLPDIDVISFAFGIRYEDMFGHRGFTHSFFFAALAGAVAAFATHRPASDVHQPVSDSHRPVSRSPRPGSDSYRPASDSHRPGSDVHRPASAVRLFVWFTVVTASHGLLDAMTNGGRGIGFFAPFSNHRYFFPWRPIQVSPIGAGFFSPRGLLVLASESVWIWLPSAIIAASARMFEGRPKGRPLRAPVRR